MLIVNLHVRPKLHIIFKKRKAPLPPKSDNLSVFKRSIVSLLCNILSILASFFIKQRVMSKKINKKAQKILGFNCQDLHY